MGRCEMCGAEVEGGSAACRDVCFGEVQAREAGDAAYAAVHLLTVDSYVLQHSESHSPRSNAFHLLRLGWLLFGGGDPDVKQTNKGPMPYIMKGYRDFPFLPPPPPGARGMTVVEALKARDAAEHREMAYRWGRTVWDAYAVHYEWAKETLGKAGVRIP